MAATGAVEDAALAAAAAPNAPVAGVDSRGSVQPGSAALAVPPLETIDALGADKPQPSSPQSSLTKAVLPPVRPHSSAGKETTIVQGADHAGLLSTWL